MPFPISVCGTFPSTPDNGRKVACLKHREGLSRFLDDGHLEIDSNTVERSIRPIALNRKNFAGHDDGAKNWGIIMSLIETRKLTDVNSQHYLDATHSRIVDGHPQSRIDELMPWNFNGSLVNIA